MLIAEVNGKRCSATKGAKGICPYCKSEVIAKCGEQKIAHWAHKSIQLCDSWHEKETEWHLMWKNYFPLEWQELIKYDEKTGEKHIADVYTPQGFTLEFQHSAIKPEERQSREQFYKNMNWVVDGTRLKNDYKRFETGIKSAKIFHKIMLPDQNQTHIGNILEMPITEDFLPKNWLNSNVPVIFDFKGLNQIDDPKDLRRFIFCLLPIKSDSCRYLVQTLPQIFIETSKSGFWKTLIEEQIKVIIRYYQIKNQPRRPIRSLPRRPTYSLSGYYHPSGPPIDRVSYYPKGHKKRQKSYFPKKRRGF